MILSSFFQRGCYPHWNQVTFLTNKQRRLDILKAASHSYGAWVDCARCDALSNEPNMKWLLKREYVYLKRVSSVGWMNRKYVRYTRAFITEKGKLFLEKSS